MSFSELLLQDNNLSSLPDELREMQQLQVIDISNNKFESLPIFRDSPQLNTVYAKCNKITGKDSILQMSSRSNLGG